MPELARVPELHGDAATVVLLRGSPRGPETLLLERPSHRGSFAGAWVFPGGHVDPADRRDAVPGSPDPLMAAARHAGIRETLEETGVVVADRDLEPLSIWTPPPTAPKRLRTWFFLAVVPEGTATDPVRLSADEHVDHVWLAPPAALERHAAGLMELFPPTWMTLRWLAGHATAAGAVASAMAAEPAVYESLRTVDGDGRAIVCWAGDEAYGVGGLPGARGGRHRITLDSLPWIYERAASGA